MRRIPKKFVFGTPNLPIFTKIVCQRASDNAPILMAGTIPRLCSVQSVCPFQKGRFLMSYGVQLVPSLEGCFLMCCSDQFSYAVSVMQRSVRAHFCMVVLNVTYMYQSVFARFRGVNSNVK